MSKLIETLKSQQDISEKKTEYQLTQEQLASIYFSGGDKQSKGSNPPLVIKVIEKPALYKAIPWIIASLAMLLAAFSLFSTKRIFVDIRVADDDAVISKSSSKQSYNPFESTPESNEGRAMSLDNTQFEGAAKAQSSVEGNRLSLVNSSIASFARANVVSQNPMNLTGYKIIFMAKGARGGEQLAIGVKDKSNNQAFSRGRFFPYPTGLTTQWQRAEVLLDTASESFDKSAVSAIRFEFGGNIQNKSGDTVFVKDIRLVPVA